MAELNSVAWVGMHCHEEELHGSDHLRHSFEVPDHARGKNAKNFTSMPHSFGL
jgi:hypothetical protein